MRGSDPEKERQGWLGACFWVSWDLKGGSLPSVADFLRNSIERGILAVVWDLTCLDALRKGREKDFERVLKRHWPWLSVLLGGGCAWTWQGLSTSRRFWLWKKCRRKCSNSSSEYIVVYQKVLQKYLTLLRNTTIRGHIKKLVFCWLLLNRGKFWWIQKILIFRGGLIQFKRVLLAQFTKKKGAFIKKWYFFDKNKGGGSWQTQKILSVSFFWCLP